MFLSRTTITYKFGMVSEVTDYPDSRHHVLNIIGVFNATSKNQEYNMKCIISFRRAWGMRLERMNWGDRIWLMPKLSNK